MRKILLFVWLLAGSLLAHGQFVCFSDSTTIYEFPGADLPPMVGEATFAYGQFKVVVGGKFLDTKNPEAEAVYNCDMVVVDGAAKKTYVLPLSYFPPFIADQFSGVNYCYTMDNDTAYIMGGYGYDLAQGYETTFPVMTIFSVKTLIDSVVQRKDYLGLFEAVVDDDRLAVTEGNLVRIGQYFLVYNGREIKSVREDFVDRPTVSEWDFRGQLRKFTLTSKQGFREVAEFQVCNTSKVFYQCMPDKWKPASKTVDFQH